MSENLRFKLKDLTEKENLKKVYVVVSKTQSVFNKDLNELPKIKRTIEKYLSQSPHFGEYPVEILPNFPNALFDFKNRKFKFGLFNASIFAHEIEHARSTEDSPVYNSMLQTSRVISNLSGASLGGIAVGEAAKMNDPSLKEGVNTLYDILSATHGVSSLPTLYEEGKANLNAILSSDEKMEALKTLGPAYTTYLAQALLPISFYQLAKQT